MATRATVWAGSGRSQTSGDRSVTNDPQRLRVTHCPVNIAGIPWENVQALRRKGSRRPARRLRARPAASGGGLVARPARAARRRLAQQAAAFARLAPRTDIFHFYFGLTLFPKSLQFPLLRAAAEEERLPLPRLRHPRQVARRARLRQARRTPRSSAPTTRSAGCPRRTSSRRGSTCAPFTPVPPSDNPRPLVVHAPSNREKKGTQLRDRRVRAAARRPRHRRRRPPRRWRASATRAPTSSSTS